MRRTPLAAPAVALLCGIIAALHGGVASALILGAAMTVAAPVSGVAAIAGVVAVIARGRPVSIEHEGRTARLAGTVASEVSRVEGMQRFVLRVAGIGLLRCTTRDIVGTGERIVVRGRVEPLDEPRNPGEPSARALGADDGIAGELAGTRVLAREPPDPRDWRSVIALARASLAARLRDALPEPQATILVGALLGERGTLPATIRDDFGATGTVHVLVTAGLHCGIVAGLALWLFGQLRLPRAAGALATIPVVIAYAVLCDAHLPVERAAVMTSVALVARAAGARIVSLNSIALAAIVVACMRPVAVESDSFALSFSCVIAIALFADPIGVWLELRRLPGWIAEALAVTIAVEIGVWPTSAAAFGTVAPYAIVANLLVVPLVGVILVVGIATVAVHPAAALAAVGARWLTWLIDVLLGITHAIAMLPGARLTIAPPPWPAIAAYDALVAGAAIVGRHRPVAGAAAIVAASVLVAIGAVAAHRPQGLSITALDVGQGDAIVIRTPHGRTIVIDTGGELERGERIDGRSPAERRADAIVLPYLQRSGITRIDLLVLTHPHGDHAGGVAGIIRMLPVNSMADSGQRYGGAAYNDGLVAARERGVPVVVPGCNARAIEDDVTLTFLTPCGPPFVDGDNDVNENSLVVMLQYRTFRALFMGDAGFQSEQRLLGRGLDLHADVLKVGHHGSAYSSSAAFIAAVHPAIALISVGRHNTFGHPAPATLEILHHTGAQIFRTDQCGAVTVNVGLTASPHVRTMLCTPPPTSLR